MLIKNKKIKTGENEYKLREVNLMEWLLSVLYRLKKVYFIYVYIYIYIFNLACYWMGYMNIKYLNNFDIILV